MKLRCLKLRYEIMGIGYAVESQVEKSLDAVLSGLRPMQHDWLPLIREKKDGDSEFRAPPRGFSGWIIGNSGKPRRHVFYQSLAALADALNKGDLQPVCPGCDAQSLGLLNSRKSASATHLKQNLATLRILGLYSIEDMEKSGSLVAEQVSDGITIVQRMTGEIFDGEMLSVFTPCTVTANGAGMTQSAVWAARSVQFSKRGRVYKRPVYFFAGTRLSRHASMDELPEKARDRLSEDGEACLVPASVLLPPVSLQAYALWNPPEPDPDAADTQETNPDSAAPKSPQDSDGCIWVPVYAAVRHAPVLNEVRTPARPKRVCLNREQTEEHVRKALPKNLSRCGYLLCRRTMPGNEAPPPFTFHHYAIRQLTLPGVIGDEP